MTAVLDRGARLRDAVGLGLALVLALAALVMPERAGWLALTGLWAAAVWVAWQDLRDFTIPDGAVVAIGLVGLAARLSTDAPGPAALAALIDIALCGGALFLVREAYFRWRGHDGIGLGDVKLGAAAGAAVGTIGFAPALFGASLAGIAVMLLRGAKGDDRLAFGVLLAPAIAMTATAQALGAYPPAGG